MGCSSFWDLLFSFCFYAKSIKNIFPSDPMKNFQNFSVFFVFFDCNCNNKDDGKRSFPYFRPAKMGGEQVNV